MNREIKLKEEYFKETYGQFKNKMRHCFKDYDLSNMEKNIKDGVELRYFSRLSVPARYSADDNMVFVGEELDTNKFSPDDKKHMYFHELVHMSSAKNVRTLRVKMGLLKAIGPIIRKRDAVNEGVTDVITEKVMGKKTNQAYLFEKMAVKALISILGEEKMFQCYFDADANSLFQHAKDCGIPKKELNSLFNDMDKQLIWRNINVCNVMKGKPIKKNNRYISKIEQKLINMAVRACMHRGEDKERIIEKINSIQQLFITPGLKFSIDKISEEEFLSEYSEGLVEAFEYAEQIKRGVLLDEITSEDQIKQISNGGLFKNIFKNKSLKLLASSKSDINNGKDWRNALKVPNNSSKFTNNDENSRRKSNYGK